MAFTSSGVGFRIQHLAADHAFHGSGGLRDETDDLYHGRGGRIEPGQRFVGLGLQGIAGQDGDGLAKGHVAGGFAAAKVVVVEGGKVVVDERVGVEHFDGCAEPLNAARQFARNGHGCLHGQHRPQTLAAGKGGVAHGAVDRGGHGIGAGKQFLQRAVGQLRALLDQRFHVGQH
jgi:hypothetical protein